MGRQRRRDNRRGRRGRRWGRRRGRRCPMRRSWRRWVAGGGQCSRRRAAGEGRRRWRALRRARGSSRELGSGRGRGRRARGGGGGARERRRRRRRAAVEGGRKGRARWRTLKIVLYTRSLPSYTTAVLAPSGILPPVLVHHAPEGPGTRLHTDIHKHTRFTCARVHKVGAELLRPPRRCAHWLHCCKTIRRAAWQAAPHRSATGLLAVGPLSRGGGIVS